MRADQVFGISPELREHSYVDRGNLDASIATYLGRTPARQPEGLRRARREKSLLHMILTKEYNRDDATGFIRLNALRLKVAAKVQRKK
jgi:hypothetical protein